jgi:P4 family phage/plasmid primase-like protien
MPSPSRLPVYNEEQIRAFLGAVLDPSVGCLEMRLFGADFERKFLVPAERYSKTFVGWYDDPDKFVVDAKRLCDVSGYIIPNPVDRVGLARADNKLIIARSHGATNDADIVCLRWLFLDIDAKRKKNDISSTDEELAKALAKRDEILAAHPEVAHAAIWGQSGNGAWLLARLPDYPNDSEHRELIARALDYFSGRFNDAGAEIDPKCKNPSRLMALPGTRKCKGSERADRPWRLATFDSWSQGLSQHPEPLDLIVWLDVVAPEKAGESEAGGPEGRSAAPGNGSRIHGIPHTLDYRIRRAILYIDAMAPAVSGQRGHDQTFDAACALIKGFDLPFADARPILERFNARCSPPWAAHELEHKLESADEKPDKKPRGYLLNESRNGFSGKKGTEKSGSGPADAQDTQKGEGKDKDRKDGPEHEFTDMGNARRLTYLHGHRVRYCKAYGDWLVYDGQRWARDDLNAIEAMAKDVPGQIIAEMPPTPNEEVGKMFRKWALVSQSGEKLASAIKVARSEPGIAVTPNDLDRNPWLLNVANGTINLRSGEFSRHRPGDLITKLAPVHYDPNATAATWDKFISEIMGDNADLVDYLRRAAGYSITGIIRQHVFFCCYGTGSNGKTTFFKTLHAVLGDYANEVDSDILVAQGMAQHPTGLTELEGRRLIVAEETEDNRRLAEALVKKLTGGNPIQARKMHKDFYTFMPSHHIFLSTNHKPEIRGMDPGIWRRIKLIPFEVSFDPQAPGGRTPDLELDDRLITEASGILNWLLKGCRDWQEQGLIEPTPVRSATQRYREEMDLLGAFIEERCMPEADSRIVLSEVYGQYCAWCDLAKTNPLSRRRFTTSLEDKGFPSKKSNSITYKLGLRLKTEVELGLEKNEYDFGDMETGEDGDNEVIGTAGRKSGTPF